MSVVQDSARMGASGSTQQVAKAQGSDEQAQKLFERIDANSDGLLSVMEIWNAAADFGK